MYAPSAGSARDTEKDSSRKSGIFAQLLIILLLTVLVVAITIGFGIQMIKAPSGAPMPNTTSGAQLPVKSGFCSKIKPIFKDCKNALRQGYNFSGLLTIKPNAYTSAFQVYCDMLSSGGGWTLVASIHEDNIRHNCDSRDMWSKTPSAEAFDNWFNLKSFGNLEDVTGEDYKNKGLYALNASDIMIWHVPNDIRLQAISDGAFFKYHTSNGFLQNYGSNLQTLFTQYIPLTQQIPQEMTEKVIECVQNSNWSNLWLGWSWDRRFPFDPVSVKNTDKVTFQFNSQPATKIYRTGMYNSSVPGAKPIKAVIRETTGVATTLLWISMPNNVIRKLKIKVDWGSFGKKQRISWDSTTRGGYSIKSLGHCEDRYCKVLFTVTNAAKWGSIPPSSYISQATSFYRTNNRTNVELWIKNINRATLVGYTVFRRKYFSLPESDDWRFVFSDMSECFDDAQSNQYEHIPGLSVPATIIKGNMDYNDSDVTPGFIQFRKYDDSGHAFPICPGIRLERNANPSLHCIGGITSGSFISRRDCGDFAAWDKLAAHSVKRATSTSGDEVTDLTSTLLLFYR